MEGDIPYWEDDDWWCDSWDDWLNPFAYVAALCDPLDREIDLQRKERGMILGKVMDIESLEKYNSTHKAGEATSTAIKSLAVTDAVFIELATCLATGARYVGMPKATSKPFHERGKLIGKFNKFHTEAERAWAHEMVAKGKKVKIVSNVEERAKAGLKSLDFIVDGVTYEVKHVHSTGKSTLKNALTEAAKKPGNPKIVIDARETTYSVDDALKHFKRASHDARYSLDHRTGILLRNDVIFF